jgi:hypothetical protein
MLSARTKHSLYIGTLLQLQLRTQFPASPTAGCYAGFCLMFRSQLSAEHRHGHVMLLQLLLQLLLPQLPRLLQVLLLLLLRTSSVSGSPSSCCYCNSCYCSYSCCCCCAPLLYLARPHPAAAAACPHLLQEHRLHLGAAGHLHAPSCKAQSTMHISNISSKACQQTPCSEHVVAVETEYTPCIAIALLAQNTSLAGCMQAPAKLCETNNARYTYKLSSQPARQMDDTTNLKVS